MTGPASERTAGRTDAPISPPAPPERQSDGPSQHPFSVQSRQTDPTPTLSPRQSPPWRPPHHPARGSPPPRPPPVPDSNHSGPCKGFYRIIGPPQVLSRQIGKALTRAATAQAKTRPHLRAFSQNILDASSDAAAVAGRRCSR